MSSTIKTPASIPKSVFYGLVKELVHDQTVAESDDSSGLKRVSAGAVALLQRSTEDYIADIFGQTGTPENKILTVESFQGARVAYDADEVRKLHNIPEGQKTILDYESGDEIFE